MIAELSQCLDQFDVFKKRTSDLFRTKRRSMMTLCRMQLKFRGLNGLNLKTAVSQ